MSATSNQSASGGPVIAPGVSASSLLGLNDIVPNMVKMSRRAWLRLCDEGLAPWGCKLRGRRLWNSSELQNWINAGCPAVRTCQKPKTAA